MKYTNSDLISSLAAEYVLGTLRGKARHRFEAIKVKHAKVQEAVHYWETQLNEMAINIEPIAPPESVWQNIQSSIGINANQATLTSNVTDISAAKQTNDKQAKDTSRVSATWQAVSGLAIAASFVLAIVFYDYTQDTSSPQSVAVFANEEQQTLWSVDVRKDSLFIRSTQNLEQRPTQDYQLWIVPESGEAPISLGLLNQSGTFSLAKPDVFDQVAIAALAVSLEPKGGSPTGAPTVVLFATELAQL